LIYDTIILSFIYFLKKLKSIKTPFTLGIDARMCGTSFTGIGRMIYEVVKRLPERIPKWNFIVFLQKMQPQECLFDFPNVEKRIANEKIYTIAEQTSFLRKISKAHVDGMYFPHFNVPLLYNKPFVSTIHDLTLFHFPGTKMNKWWQRKAFQKVIQHTVQKSKSIMTVSEYAKSEIEKEFQGAKNKVEVVPNGVSEGFFHQKKTQHEAFLDVQKKLHITKPFFLYTGVWREHKNIPGLLKAFAMLKRKGIEAQLVMTGRGNAYQDEMKKIIEKYHIQDDVIMSGLVSEEDLQTLFRAARSLIFPSFAEGFGLPALEAMASETPVCSSNTTSLPEVCGKAAYFFDPNNIEEMATSMEYIFCNESMRYELIQKGKEQALKYTWDKAADRVAEVLKKSFTSKTCQVC